MCRPNRRSQLSAWAAAHTRSGPVTVQALFERAGVPGPPGMVLPGGSPVGLMGGPGDGSDLLAASAGSEGGATRSETLYIEMRQDNEPVDPLAWFQTDKEG